MGEHMEGLAGDGTVHCPWCGETFPAVSPRGTCECERCGCRFKVVGRKKTGRWHGTRFPAKGKPAGKEEKWRHGSAWKAVWAEMKSRPGDEVFSVAVAAGAGCLAGSFLGSLTAGVVVFVLSFACLFFEAYGRYFDLEGLKDAAILLFLAALPVVCLCLRLLGMIPWRLGW